MPGISGIIAKMPPAQREANVARMSDSLIHENWYRSGVLSENRLDAALGWVCHPNSFSDCLPVWNSARDIGLVFCGENFGWADKENASAVSEDGGSTAASLVRLYEEDGANFFERLNGNFGGVLLDLREKKVILFNDRYGLNRIYYHETKDAFYFSSEAKALLNIVPALRRLNEQSLGEFFSCGCALQDRSLFDGIYLLPTGSKWTFRDGGKVEKERYFTPQAVADEDRLPAKEYYPRLKEIFSASVPAYFEGRQPAALSLTGGLDSRMIIAVARQAPGKLPCYTFGGMYRECADVTISRKIAKVCGQPYQVIPVGRAFLSEFPTLAARSVYLTDGAMDVSGSVELFANRFAREIAPVRVTGNYGSEILRSHLAFAPSAAIPADMFNGDFAPFFREARETYAGERRGSIASFIAFKQVPWHHHGRFKLEQTQLTVRSPFLDNPLVSLASRAPLSEGINKEFAHRLIAEGNPALGELPTDRGRANHLKFLPYRAAKFIQEFLPRAEYVYDYGMPQRMARVNNVLEPFHFDRLFLGRQKFYHFRTWYRHELASHVREILLDQRTLSRPYLNRRRVEAMVQAHTSGFGNYTLPIHKLMTSELLQRQLID